MGSAAGESRDQSEGLLRLGGGWASSLYCSLTSVRARGITEKQQDKSYRGGNNRYSKMLCITELDCFLFFFWKNGISITCGQS